MEYPHSVFMLKVKQGILYDHITNRWPAFLCQEIYILQYFSLNKVWYSFIEWGNWECTGKKNTKIGYLIHLKDLIKVL